MGDPGVPLPEALDRVLAFSARHERPPLAVVELGSGTEAALAALGWAADRPGAGPHPARPGRPHPAAASAGRPERRAARRRTATGWRCGSGDAARGRGRRRGRLARRPRRARRPGPPAAAGWRAQVVAALLEWGAERGATTAWLHVESDNAPGGRAVGGDRVPHPPRPPLRRAGGHRIRSRARELTRWCAVAEHALGEPLHPPHSSRCSSTTRQPASTMPSRLTPSCSAEPTISGAVAEGQREREVAGRRDGRDRDEDPTMALARSVVMRQHAGGAGDEGDANDQHVGSPDEPGLRPRTRAASRRRSSPPTTRPAPSAPPRGWRTRSRPRAVPQPRPAITHLPSTTPIATAATAPNSGPTTIAPTTRIGESVSTAMAARTTASTMKTR